MFGGALKTNYLFTLNVNENYEPISKYKFYSLEEIESFVNEGKISNKYYKNFIEPLKNSNYLISEKEKSKKLKYIGGNSKTIPHNLLPKIPRIFIQYKNTNNNIYKHYDSIMITENNDFSDGSTYEVYLLIFRNLQNKDLNLDMSNLPEILLFRDSNIQTNYHPELIKQIKDKIKKESTNIDSYLFTECGRISIPYTSVYVKENRNKNEFRWSGPKEEYLLKKIEKLKNNKKKNENEIKKLEKSLIKIIDIYNNPQLVAEDLMINFVGLKTKKDIIIKFYKHFLRNKTNCYVFKCILPKKFNNTKTMSKNIKGPEKYYSNNFHINSNFLTTNINKYDIKNWLTITNKYFDIFKNIIPDNLKSKFADYVNYYKKKNMLLDKTDLEKIKKLLPFAMKMDTVEDNFHKETGFVWFDYRHLLCLKQKNKKIKPQYFGEKRFVKKYTGNRDGLNYFLQEIIFNDLNNKVKNSNKKHNEQKLKQLFLPNINITNTKRIKNFYLENTDTNNLDLLTSSDFKSMNNTNTEKLNSNKINFNVGDKVRIKSFIKNPNLGWGGINHKSIGIIEKIKKNVVKINFKERKDWIGNFDEIEKIKSTIKI